MASPTGLFSLPDELLLLILVRVHDTDLQSLMKVCRTLRRLVLDKPLLRQRRQSQQRLLEQRLSVQQRQSPVTLQLRHVLRYTHALRVPRELVAIPVHFPSRETTNNATRIPVHYWNSPGQVRLYRQQCVLKKLLTLTLLERRLPDKKSWQYSSLAVTACSPVLIPRVLQLNRVLACTWLNRQLKQRSSLKQLTARGVYFPHPNESKIHFYWRKQALLKGFQELRLTAKDQNKGRKRVEQWAAWWTVRPQEMPWQPLAPILNLTDQDGVQSKVKWFETLCKREKSVSL